MALLVTAIANAAANRKMTFGVDDSTDVLKHHAGGLIAFGIGLGLTSGSLWLLDLLVAGPHRGAEIVVLILANGRSTVIRILALRQLMGRPTKISPTKISPSKISPTKVSPTKISPTKINEA